MGSGDRDSRPLSHTRYRGSVRSPRAWLLRLAAVFGADRRDRELSAELESHLQLHIDDNLRVGMTPVEARRHAVIALGGVEQTKERYRDRRGLPQVEYFLHDLRFGLRMWRRNPAFTVVSIIVLAVGIAATDWPWLSRQHRCLAPCSTGLHPPIHWRSVG
jgi:hypothetical protein